MIDKLFITDFISISELSLRVGLALLFGMIVGLDRDSKNKLIDFRAYMIVCVTTCLIALLGQQLQETYGSSGEFYALDLGKIIAGVLTGIGFLGAGAIIKRDNDQVVGTATGASIWACGAIGLALGFGAYALAMVGFFSVAGTLIIGGVCMAKFQGRSDKENID